MPLVIELCNQAIIDANICKKDIHKLIVVSSTGFLGPSLDCDIIKELELEKTIDRTLVGFMGCAAAMNGFRIASDFVNSHPGKCVLMVCVEISSVHANFNTSINDIVTHSIFSDGAAACILSSNPSISNFKSKSKSESHLSIVDSYSYLMDDTEDGINLEITDNGITCKLSKNLPKYINENIRYTVDTFLKKHNLTRDDISFWAIHPGGRRIIEEVQHALGISKDDTKESWNILKNYGNMLSSSIIFVLESIMKREKETANTVGGNTKKYVFAVSFSPGVGTECLLLQIV